MKENPNIERVIGHSLGGSVAFDLQKNDPHLTYRTYGAPVLNMKGLLNNSDNKDVEISEIMESLFQYWKTIKLIMVKLIFYLHALPKCTSSYQI